MHQGLNLEPKDGDFVKYIEALQKHSASLDALKLANRDVISLSDTPDKKDGASRGKATDLLTLFGRQKEGAPVSQEYRAEQKAVNTSSANQPGKIILGVLLALGMVLLFVGISQEIEPMIVFGAFFVIAANLILGSLRKEQRKKQNQH